MSEERSPIIAWLSKFVVLAVAAFVLYQLQNIAALAFIGVIVASAVRPAVRFGKKFYIPAAVSIMVTYVLLFTIISVLLSLVIPPLANESAALVQRATTTLGLEDMRIVERISLDVTQLGEVAQNFDQYNGVLTQLTGSVQVVLGLLTSTFSLLFISLVPATLSPTGEPVGNASIKVKIGGCSGEDCPLCASKGPLGVSAGVTRIVSVALTVA